MRPAIATVTERLNSVQRPATSEHCLSAVCNAETRCSRTSVSSLPNPNRGKNDIADTPNEPGFAHTNSNGGHQEQHGWWTRPKYLPLREIGRPAERGGFVRTFAPREPPINKVIPPDRVRA